MIVSLLTGESSIPMNVEVLREWMHRENPSLNDQEVETQLRQKGFVVKDIPLYIYEGGIQRLVVATGILVFHKPLDVVFRQKNLLVRAG